MPKTSPKTWQYLKYLTGAAHYMTELMADLEIELHKQDKDVEDLAEPGNPPELPLQPGEWCIPPVECKMDVADLHEYANRLSVYIGKIMERTASHIAEAREKGVKEFPYSVVYMPETKISERW